MPGHARQSGFTLVEVVVALTILSLVMLTTVTALRTLANTQTAIERLTQRVDEVRTVSSFLRDTLESAVPGSGGGSGGLALGGTAGAGSTYFRIFPEALEWKSIVLFGEGFGGTQLLRVAREENSLVLRWTAPEDSTGVPDWPSAPSRVLVSNLEELQVSYRREFNGDWQREWDRAGTPYLVRLQIKSSGRYWPELIIGLRE